MKIKRFVWQFIDKSIYYIFIKQYLATDKGNVPIDTHYYYKRLCKYAAFDVVQLIFTVKFCFYLFIIIIHWLFNKKQISFMYHIYLFIHNPHII